MSLRGAQRRGNLLVPLIEMYSSIETLYREIAPQEYFFASLRAPRPFGPRNDSIIESFSVNRLVGAGYQPARQVPMTNEA